MAENFTLVENIKKALKKGQGPTALEGPIAVVVRQRRDTKGERNLSDSSITLFRPKDGTTSINVAISEATADDNFLVTNCQCLSKKTKVNIP